MEEQWEEMGKNLAMKNFLGNHSWQNNLREQMISTWMVEMGSEM